METIDESLFTIWADILKNQDIKRTDNFFDVGGDISLSNQLVDKINTTFSISISALEIFEYPTIKDLSAYLEEVNNKESAVSDKNRNKEELFEEKKRNEKLFFPMQKYFLLNKYHDIHYNNFSQIFKIAQPFDDSCLEIIVDILLKHHSIFKTKMEYVSDTWHVLEKQLTPEAIGNLLLKIDLDEFEETEHNECVEYFCSKVQASLDLTNEQLIKIVYFKSSQESRLFIVVHKVVFDIKSWKVLLNDFNTLLNQFQNNQPLYLSVNKVFSYYDFTADYVKSVSENELSFNKKFWLNHLHNPESGLFPLDNSKYASDLNTDTEKKVITLSEEYTSVFLSENAFKPDEMLLAALLRVFEKVNNNVYARFLINENYREESNNNEIAEVIGCFEYLFPVTLSNVLHTSWIDLLKYVKQQLRTNRLYSKGYGILKFLNDDDDLIRLSLHEYSWMPFTYSGNKDEQMHDIQNSFFSGVHYAVNKGIHKHPESRRENCLAFEGYIKEDRLHIDIAYNPNQYLQKTIANLAYELQKSLEELMDFCSNNIYSGLTPSDFPLVKINQIQLDNLEYKFSGIKQILPVSDSQKNFILNTYTAFDANSTQFILTISGDIDSDQWTKSWAKTIDAFPVLRSAFDGTDIENLIQIFLEKIQVNSIFKNFEQYTIEEQPDLINNYLKDVASEDFSVDSAPLYNIHLIKLSPEKHIFVFNFYKALLDEESVQLIWNFVCANYNSGTAALDNKINNIHKPDASQNAIEAYAYWNKRIRKIEEDFFVENEIEDIPNRNDLTREYKDQEFSIFSETKEALYLLASESQSSLESVFQGLWAYLLHAYTNENNVFFNSIGSVSAVYTESSECKVGMNSSFIPVIVDFDYRDINIFSYLKQIYVSWQEGLKYASFLPHEIQKKHVYNTNPLFDSVLNIVEGIFNEKYFNALSSFIKTEKYVFKTKTNHQLLIRYSEHAGNTILFQYNSQSFSDSQIEGIFSDFMKAIDLFSSNLKNKISVLKKTDIENHTYSKQIFHNTENNPDTILESEGREFPYNENEKIVLEIWQQVLRVDNISLTDSFFELGGDSLKATRVFSMLKDRGYKLAILDIFESKTIVDICTKIQLSKDVVAFTKRPDIKAIGYLMPFHFMYLNQLKGKAWNISEIYFSEKRFDESILQKTLDAIYNYHDALRIRFDGNIQTSYFYRDLKIYNRSAAEVKPLLIFHDWSNLDTISFQKKIRENTYIIENENTFENDQLASVALYRGRDGDHIYIMVSHLICDGISFEILTEDIFSWYKILLTGNKINFKRKTDSFVLASVKNYEYANSNEIFDEIPYWCEVYESFKNNLLFPRDYAIKESDKLFKNSINLSENLISKDVLTRLEKICHAHKVTIVDLVIIVLGRAIRKWASVKTFGAMFVNSGRQYSYSDIDVSRTVGCFAIGNHIKIDCSDDTIGILEQVIAHKSNRDKVPNGGAASNILMELGYYRKLDYGDVLRQKLNALLPADLPYITFNYFNLIEVSDNQYNNFVVRSPCSSSHAQIDSEAGGFDFFKIEIQHYKEKLFLDWRYNKLEFKHETIQGMIDEMKKILNELEQ